MKGDWPGEQPQPRRAPTGTGRTALEELWGAEGRSRSVDNEAQKDPVQTATYPAEAGHAAACPHPL